MEEKVDSVAKVCRLCGQFESIYIDVFGEEGTRRLLGLKIHSKINIVIDETDPLPKTICVQCLGKLEFVCDFQEECLRTQRLLRDRYDLPPLPDLDNNTSLFTEPVDVKPEEITNSPPSTSINNNSTEKNLNSTAADIENVDPSSEKQPPAAEEEPRPSKRSLRPSPRSKSNEKHSLPSEVEQPNRRWLRSRNTTESSKTLGTRRGKRSSVNKSHTSPVSRVTRLRSQNLQKSSTPPPLLQQESSQQNVLHSEEASEERQTIQIPTSALNKVLTAVSSSQDVEVCVKESKGRNGDIEDISFTLELRKKVEETENVVTVHAKVFPDQGSCLVDSEIVDLLGGNDNSELNKIMTPLTKSKSSKDKETKDSNSKLKELEKRLSSISDGSDLNGIASRNPEELYRMDGEEIRVDDNVESTIVDGQSGYSCKLCKKFYERRDKCTVHVKTHLGIKQFACTLCTAKFVCKSDVMKHIRCSHTNPRPMQCPKCPKRFRSKFDLTEHDNVHKGIKPYTCNDCGQSYHHKVSLQMHVKSHLPPQNLACEYCGKVFPFRTRLLSHIGSVHLKNRRNFRCRFCYNLYSSLAVLNEHIKTRHATTYTCEICGKSFKVASKYKAHVLQHSNPKPFVCNICNNKYASKAFLNEHLLKHEGLRKHVCQKCGASFAQASHLAAHRHVHGEKTHACPECGRKFNRRDNMKVHRKRHFAESGRIVSGQKNKEDDGGKSDDNGEQAEDSDEKIKEDDDLPKTVCIRCIGFLEFVCDFHDECHETQERLQKKNENQPPASTIATDVGRQQLSEEKSSPSPGRKMKKSILMSLENSENIPPFRRRSPHSSDKILAEIHSNGYGNVPNTIQPLTLKAERSSLKPVVIRQSLQRFIWSPLECEKKTEIFLNSPQEDKLTIVKKKECKNMKIEKSLIDIIKSSESEKLPNESEEMISIPSVLDEKRLEDSLTMKSKLGDKKGGKKREVRQSTLNSKKIIEESEDSGSEEECQLNETLEKENKKRSRLMEEESIDEACTMIASNAKMIQQENSKRATQREAYSVGIRRTLSESSNACSLKSTGSKRRKAGSVYGTISELMTPEEKEAIEKFYIVDMSAVNESKVESHLDLSSDKKKRIVCGICSAIYTRIDKCRVHIWAHLDMKPYKCTGCDFSTVTVSNIRCHIRKSHLKIKPFECNICRKRYVTAVLLEEHLNTHSGMRPFKCKFCSFTSASRQVLSYHMTTHKTVKDVSCEICDKKFYSKGRMRAHMSTHNKNRDLMCKYCSQRFSSAESLEKHMDNVHSKDYICNICGKATKSRKALHNHQNVHSEAKYKCTLCPNVYKSSHILREHLLKHKGIRKYKCEMCDKDFAQQSHLAAHMAVHSDKRFNCPGCDRAFNRHDNMKSHTKKCALFNANSDVKQRTNQGQNIEGKEEKQMEMTEESPYRIGQVMVFPIPGATKENDYNGVKETVTVIENVIGLECF